MLKTTPRNSLLHWSLLSATLMAAMTGIHHIYRLGWSALLPFGLFPFLPFALFWLYQRHGDKHLLWAYGAFNTLLFVAFGLFDGFLDHVLKALGVPNVTFLPGSEKEVVDTVFALWSPQAGHAFYEGTGILTFLLGVIALYFVFQVLHPQRQTAV